MRKVKLEDLKPDVHVHKRFGKDVTVEYYQSQKVFSFECSLLRNIKVQEGLTQDYRKLAEFHYRSHRLPPPRAIFRAVRDGEVVGVIVYSYPSPVASGRKNVGLGKMPLCELNKALSSISRVVVHPKYRSIGVGQKLVRETLPCASTSMVETIAVMARYNPFFERAGMQKICEQPPAKQVVKIASRLPSFGFNMQRIGSTNYNLSVLRALSERQLLELRQVFAKNAHPRLMRYFSSSKVFGKRVEYVNAIVNASLERLAGLIKVVSLLCQVKVYLFWRNPKWEEKLSR
ncbi:MAG: GNAT family N-acetyltransferase [Candidatus Bathyarchaeota archaeon]|jgi:GNAT superfamily N-acetyltransferase